MIRYSFLILFLVKFGSAFGQDSLKYITSEQTQIDVKVNEPFIIKLRACHSCGYHWTLEQIDTLNIKLISMTSKNTSGRPMRGGDAFEFWKFIGINIGKYKLEFIKKGPGKDYKVYGRCNFDLWVNL